MLPTSNDQYGVSNLAEVKWVVVGRACSVLPRMTGMPQNRTGTKTTQTTDGKITGKTSDEPHGLVLNNPQP